MVNIRHNIEQLDKPLPCMKHLIPNSHSKYQEGGLYRSDITCSTTVASILSKPTQLSHL
ncbi:hypothetical protein ACEV96_17840 [Vibrio parahaemolyticus]